MDMENVSHTGSAYASIPDGSEYKESDILFLDNVRNLPLVNGSLRVDKFVSVMCYTGKLQSEVNTMPYTIHANQILICHSNDIISNTMVSPDFDGTILCLSSRMTLELFGNSSMWDYFYHLVKSPVITVGNESLEMLRIYGKALSEKIKMGPTSFRKEIVGSIVKAIFYEVRENINDTGHPDAKGLRHGEVLFRQFVELLSSCLVKSRSVSWYAEQLCITPKHLSTTCKQVSGKTALEWINEYVAIDIRNLLKNTDKSIKEVVDLLKFPNASFFGAYCRKHFGMTPMGYRKFLRSNDNENAHTKQQEQNARKKMSETIIDHE